MRPPHYRGWPGGGSAAIHASRLGLSTIVVEADPEVGTPVHCGECLSDLAVQEFGFADTGSCQALDVKGIRVIFPGGETSCLQNLDMFSRSICLNSG